MVARFFSLRYISIVAVISLFVGAALMFIIGAVRILNTLAYIFFDSGNLALPHHLDSGTIVSIAMVQVVEAFLFALVLLIFSYGIYTLFVLSPDERREGDLPVWLHVSSIGELKTTLLQVIIVILAVNVLEHVILVGPEELKWETLIIPISILCLAGALLLMHTSPAGPTEQ